MPHAVVGFADELVLEVAAQGPAQSCEQMPWAGDGFQNIVDFAGCRVEFEEEALRALLDVHGRCGVEEAKVGWGVDCLHDAAHVEGPEAEGVGFHGDDLTWLDARGGVGYTRPSVVEHGPLAEGLLGCFECGFAVTDARARRIVNEAERETLGWIKAVCERQTRG